MSPHSRPRDGAVAGPRRRPAALAALLALAAVVSLLASASAAATAAPHWSIVSQAQPTYFQAGSVDDYRVIARNDGAQATSKGSVVSVTDTLPAGVTATKILTRTEGANGAGSPLNEMTCPEPPLTGTITCTYEEGAHHGPVLPGVTITLTITVSIPSGVQRLTPNTATVSGGGAASASISETTPIDDEPVPFGLSYFDLDVTDESGQPDTLAGSHPYELSADLAFNVSSREVPSSASGHQESPLSSYAPKDLEVALPSGLIGDPSATPRCDEQTFLEREALNCPLDTEVGTIKPFFYGKFPSAVYPVFNIVPPPNQPAELGFTIGGIEHIPILFHVRSDGDYGLTMRVADIPESGPLQGAVLTLWGVPAAPAHDLEREGTLAEGGTEGAESCKPQIEVEAGVELEHGCPSDAPQRPFLTLPSQCQTSALAAAVSSDSWQEPGPPLQAFTPEPIALQAVTGCERLSFAPSLSLAPETTQAAAPSGFSLDLHLPQNDDPDGLATPALRSATLSLPSGVVLSPSAAGVLQACTQEQFAAHSLLSASCPTQSRIGSVKITAPWLPDSLKGQIYLGAPSCAPCSSAQAQEGDLLRILLQAQGAGVTVKLEGSAAIDQSTGQLTVSFKEIPQLAFEDLKLTLNGGSRALLANPATCATPLAASAWLSPYSGQAPAQPSSVPYELSGCSRPRFQPSFQAGTVNNQAGAFSPLIVTLSRTDADEELRTLSAHLPPGLFAMLSKVSLCAQAQALAGACTAQSRIGTVTVGAGPGPNPVFLQGDLYITGPYEGAPFGLSLVVPAVVGPLDLGTIRIGAKLEVDPATAALTIVTDPLPQSLDGIPLQIKTVNLNVDREGFVFNPTNCSPFALEAALQGVGGATALASSRFQAANCATLPFNPKLTALTHAKTTKASGAYLHMRIAGSSGQANIAQVKVDLPKQLTARLSTLQKACPIAVIRVDPATCPPGSVVGSATVLTPVLRAPLAGPVYLVSGGSTAAPDIELVLQGEGVTVDLLGHTSVQHGIIASAFRSLPDLPISMFGLVLDEGSHSLFAANLPRKAKHSMCAQRLLMPTSITGQNGAVLKQTTKITVSGCATRRRRLKDG